MGRKACIIKLKHQCHLSQWREWVYGTKSWKERWLWCESMFVVIDERTLTLKNRGRRSFSYEPKHQCHLSQWEELVYGPNHEKKEDYYVNPPLS